MEYASNAHLTVCIKMELVYAMMDTAWIITIFVYQIYLLAKPTRYWLEANANA
jgi:hypothetical protein